MNILLTGATGFLGSNLCASLLKDGHDVSILKRTFSSVEKIKNLLNDTNLKSYDLDTCDLEEIFQRNRFDIIVHVATQYGRNNKNLSDILEANVSLPVRLIELGIKYNVKSFINTDTYFNKVNLDYSNLINYSLSKRTLLIWLKHLSSNIQIVNVSLEHIYGPNDSEMKFVEMLFRKIAIDKVERIELTHGHQRRDFIYVTDVVNAYLMLIKYAHTQNFSYRTFQVGTGQCCEIAELARMIKKLSSSKTILGFGDIPYRHDEIMESKADIKHMADLGWKASVKLSEGVANILELYALKYSAE